MHVFRPLSGYDFARAAAWRTVLYAAACVLFTPAILSLRLIFDCTNQAGPCVSTTLFMLFWVKPAIYVAFILSFLGICVGRALHAGLPVLLAIGVLLLFFADIRFGTALGFATGPDLALMGFWGSPEPHFFLPALAIVAAMCVLRARATAPPTWRARLGLLPGAYAMAVLALLFAAAIWGSVDAAGRYLPALRQLAATSWLWQAIGDPLTLIARLAPLLLLPVAAGEWAASGHPGRHTIWFAAVLGAVAFVCAASVVSVLSPLLVFTEVPADMTPATSVFVNVLNLAGLLSSLVLPALLAKMLQGSVTPAQQN